MIPNVQKNWTILKVNMVKITLKNFLFKIWAMKKLFRFWHFFNKVFFEEAPPVNGLRTRDGRWLRI